ncbi:hypothetical protein H0N98_04365 [Candidatus Micrarchaeota archaeon]|nr:hypothetical protein [Candidatus Micrarchaeota archaeon]
MKKGQSWAEYITVLAVTVIMAGIAMYMAGAFMGNNRQISEKDSASYWFSADVGITRYYVNSSAAQLLIKNNKNFKINVTNISSTGVSILLAPDGANSVVLEPGQSVQVTVPGLTCLTGAYSLPLVITYADVNYGAKYTVYGEKPLIGQCMNFTSPPAAQCSPPCTTNTTACIAFCSVNLKCTFQASSATCQIPCVGTQCTFCLPNCGNPTCTSCGTNSTCVQSNNWCNGTQSCLADTADTCSIPCSSGACTSCQACTPGTCTNCTNGCNATTGLCNPAAPTCQGCTFNGYCNSSCTGSSCTTFDMVCDNAAPNAQACSNSTGGTTGGPPYYSKVTCCSGTAQSCGTNSTITCLHTANWCNGATQNCSPDIIVPCNISCSGAGVCDSCTPTCTTGACTNCPGGQSCNATTGLCNSVCQSDCTFGVIGICNSSCSGSCTGWLSGCAGFNKGKSICADTYHNVSCCNDAPTSCATNSTSCNAYCNANQNCTYPFNPATCQRTCNSTTGLCQYCTPSCGTATCTGCGTSSIPCNPYCSSNRRCVYPSNPVTCTNTCSGGSCQLCTPSCGTATCNNCAAGCIGAGVCVPFCTGAGDTCNVNCKCRTSNPKCCGDGRCHPSSFLCLA